MGVAEKIFFGLFLPGVWCNNWFIRLPEKIEALSGSCVHIECEFEIEEKYDQDLTESAAGLWFKYNLNNPNNLVFNSKNPSEKHFRGKITGKLQGKNCTTIFYDVSSNHNGKYYFRIEGNGGLKYTYHTPFVTINVIESPHNPTVKLYVDQKEVQSQQEVLEGSSVSLSCSAETLCSSPPATLTWSSTPRLPFSLEEQQSQTELISHLNFTATHLQHTITFTCTVTYQLQNDNKTAQESLMLHVQYSPKNTSVSVFPSDPVLEGSSVTLNCSSDANPAVIIYTWYRDNGGELEQLLRQTGDTLIFNKIISTHRGWYYCRAQNKYGTQNSSVLLDVQYSPKNTSVSMFPSDPVLEGSSVTLTCSCDANPAVINYTWYRDNGGELEQLIRQTGDTLIFNKIISTQRGWYYCRAQNKYGTQNSTVLLDVQYVPQISISSSCNRTDISCVCWCEVDGNPSPKLEWHLSGCPVTNSINMSISEERLSSTVLRSFITLHHSLTHTTSLLCVTTNTHGTAKKLFQLQQTASFQTDFPSLMIGAAVGATVMAILCIIAHLYKKWICKTRREDETGLVLTDGAVSQENDGESLYANKAMLSPVGAATMNHTETLHYSSIDFRNTKQESAEIRGVSSLTADYAVIRYGQTMAHGEAKIRGDTKYGFTT
ncbi:B-cell receptor CD22-like [Myxocyprinus asiaticus]|uniref:B-cell receptor CD22-like n=1 Tax=Myxocyprinus asiaticus TaxID=70543 RepID=UPI0022219291|nr:B-cell receptor CD22-like [Myxocyprinus asiaticus]